MPDILIQVLKGLFDDNRAYVAVTGTISTSFLCFAVFYRVVLLASLRPVYQ
jgi:hypothetical protein